MKTIIKIALGCAFFSYSIQATYTSKVQDWLKNQTSSMTKNPPEPSAIPADIAYWIADIKFNEDGVKIVELGDGNFAGYKVLDNMHFKGKVWSQVWENLLKSEVPVWYVGAYESEPNVVAFEKFKSLGGLHASSLDSLQRNPEFLRQAKKEVSLPIKAIKDYQGIIVLKRYNPSLTTFENFVGKYPNFLILNETSSLHVSDKNLTNSLFDSPEMMIARPKAVIRKKKYTKTLADEILKELPSEWLVVKPVNSGRGNGIIMVDRKHLKNVLYRVLVENKSNFPTNDDYTFKPDTPMSYEYWRYDRNSRFIVEEYAESKPIMVENKPYDATMRIIFVMRYEQGTITLDFIDAYWKKPIKALTDQGTFKEKHISKHAPNFEESQGLAVSKADRKAVEEAMAPILPRLFWNILVDCHASEDHTQEIARYTDLRLGRYAERS